jgi:hypothetical protein
MATAKTDKKKTTKGSIPSKSAWGWLYQPGALVIMAVLCSSPIVYGYVLRNLPAVDQVAEFMVQQEQITIHDKPAYLPEDLVNQIIKNTELSLPISIWSSGLAEKIAQGAKLHPWVTKAVKVELLPQKGIVLHLNFRQPVAFIKTPSGFYPIDREGVLLPPKDFSAESVRQYPIISNVQSVPQGPEGTNWGDLSVIGAARLAEYLHPVNAKAGDKISDYWIAMALEEIVIPKLIAPQVEMVDLDYQIKVKGGSILNWGVAPGVEHNRQPTSEQKLLRMLKYYQEFGSFTAPRGPYEIDFRHWTETYRRPL